jgi:hypothetical protein
MNKKWIKWILLGNWILSPAWYVLAWFLYMLALGVQSGQAVCSGPLDIILTILLILFYLPFGIIMGLSHYPFELAIYYLISGTLLYVSYRIYKKHKTRGIQ